MAAMRKPIAATWPEPALAALPRLRPEDAATVAPALPARWQVALVHLLARLLFGLLSRRRVTGLEHLPREGPCLLVFNHLSLLDGPLLASGSPRRDLSPIATADFRRRPISRLLIEAGGGLWIGKGVGSRAALAAALALLGQGRVVAIAPEGRRSPTGALVEAKPGPAFLAARAGVPIVPVALTGTEHAARDLLRLRRPHLTVRFGEPFRLPSSPPGTNKAERRAATDLLMAHLAALLPPAYRGVYGGLVEAAGDSQPHVQIRGARPMVQGIAANRSMAATLAND